jgi:methylated-DNA-protein-cysteine methyltransferase-like protein
LKNGDKTKTGCFMAKNFESDPRMNKKQNKPTSEISFTQQVIEVIKRIPRGKVATYGQIAALAGNPHGARQVVRVLHTCTEKHKLPWHRVVNRQGRIALKLGYGYEIQRELLQREGVGFEKNDSIDFGRYLWSSYK